MIRLRKFLNDDVLKSVALYVVLATLAFGMTLGYVRAQKMGSDIKDLGRTLVSQNTQIGQLLKTQTATDNARAAETEAARAQNRELLTQLTTGVEASQQAVDVLLRCTTPTGEPPPGDHVCADQAETQTAAVILLLDAHTACFIKETIGYDHMPDRTPAEIAEVRQRCHMLLSGDALDVIRRATPPSHAEREK